MLVIAGSDTVSQLALRVAVAEWGGVVISIAAPASITLDISCQFREKVSDKMVLRSCWKSRHKNSSGPAPCWIRAGSAALLWLCVTQFACGSGAVGETKNVVQKDAEFDVTYNDTVTSENQTIYAFNHTVSRNKVSLFIVFHLVTSRSKEYNVICSLLSVGFRRRECVCLWMCCRRVWRVLSCLWCDRSKLCCLFKSLSY